MIRASSIALGILLLSFVAAASQTGAQPPAAGGLQITDQEAVSAGKRLWKNECDGTVSGLTSWNAGENFASLGIGHYIWYPHGERGPFEESFPELVHFLAGAGVTLPAWLRVADGCPWRSRAEFEQAQHSPELTSLRELLAGTVALQARFSANRLEASLPKMLAAAPGEESERVRRQFYRVAAAPNGVYALLDYVNFKGEGVLPTERYVGHGWGLLQVLAAMPDVVGVASGPAAARAFSAAAAKVLAQRVALSPPERHEQRWLPGWTSRVRTYAP